MTGEKFDPWSLSVVNRMHIIRVLNEAKGNKSLAAHLLGISRRTLYRRLLLYNLGHLITKRVPSELRKLKDTITDELR